MLECILNRLCGLMLPVGIVGRVLLGAGVSDQAVRGARGEFVDALFAEGDGAYVLRIGFVPHPPAHVRHALTGEIGEACDEMIQLSHCVSSAAESVPSSATETAKRLPEGERRMSFPCTSRSPITEIKSETVSPATRR